MSAVAFFIGLFAASAHPLLLPLLQVLPLYPVYLSLVSWQVYAIVRVVGYTLLGVALTRIALQLFKQRRLVVEEEVRKLLLWALVLIALDFALKAAVANSVYQPLLKELTRV